MPGPGEYRPDPIEGIDDVRDLPAPHRKQRKRDRKHAPCPYCGRRCPRRRTATRMLHDLGNRETGRPVELDFLFSVHRCPDCEKYFSIDLSDMAAPGSPYTKRVLDMAVRYVVEDGSPYRDASWRLWRDHRVFVPFATIQNWVESSGEKKYEQVETDVYLDWAFEAFSGYIAVDEVYGLYDRRCRRATALEKLRKLRERLKRFKRLSQVLSKLESPTVDRSLVFLDDKQLPSTSNAVERGNRRFRKMQKTVYRVRTCGHLKERVALDMFRDSRLPPRRRTIQSPHNARAGLYLLILGYSLRKFQDFLNFSRNFF